MAPDGRVITQLNVSHLRVDDGGLFSCVAYHGDNLIAHHDRLNVYGKKCCLTNNSLFLFRNL